MINPRYLAYCKMMGYETVEEALAQEEIEWPGGKMTGFILWINAMWAKWNKINKHPPREPHDNTQHKEFDIWLQNKNLKNTGNDG